MEGAGRRAHNMEGDELQSRYPTTGGTDGYAIVPQLQIVEEYQPARREFARLVAELAELEHRVVEHADIERRIAEGGQKVTRLMMQGHLVRL